MSETSRDWDRLFVTGGGLLGRPPEENDLLGSRVGRFDVVDVIGRGGMSTVYLGERRDDTFEQRVALKILETASSKTAASGFQRERQILARLDHPAIARIFDGGTLEDGRPWFAMEYVAGDPIDEHCQRVDANLQTRMRLAEQVLAALAAAHREGVVHHDLKPENILIDRHGHPKLLDFGIARIVSEEATSALALMTPRYAAPEQFEDGPAGAATDIYQVGLLIYLLATDRHAAGDATSVRELRQHARSLPLEAASQLEGPFRSRLDRDFDAIVQRCLKADPEDRYPSAEAVLADLRAWREGRSTSVAARWSAPRRWWRHRRTAIIGVGGVVVAAAIAGLYAWERIERERIRSEAVSELASNVLTDTPEAADRIAASSFELSAGAVADDPELERELTLLTGEALLREDRVSQAVSMVENVLSRTRGDFEGETVRANGALYSLLGEAYRRLGRADDAIRVLDLAAEALADHPSTHLWATALERRAAAQIQQHNPEQALADLQQIATALASDDATRMAVRIAAKIDAVSGYLANGCDSETGPIAGTAIADAIARRCEAASETQ